VRSYVEDEEREDFDIERGQIAVLKLLVRVLEEKEVTEYMRAAGSLDHLRTFIQHPNRSFSSWSLSALIGMALLKFS